MNKYTPNAGNSQVPANSDLDTGEGEN